MLNNGAAALAFHGRRVPSRLCALLALVLGGVGLGIAWGLMAMSKGLVAMSSQLARRGF